MANAKEIRTKIKSIKSTQKITRAMEMVAASKMRKAQKKMQRSRPYSSRIRDVIGHLSQGRLEVEHAYLVERPVKRVGFMIISTDRGLCGGLNTNLFKEVLKKMSFWQEKKVVVDCCVLGRKAISFFSKHGANIIGQSDHIGDEASIKSLIGSVKVMLDNYDQEKIDKVFLAYNKFENTMAQKATIEDLLPIIDPCREQEQEQRRQCWDYLYEPEPNVLLEALLKRYIESLVYQGVVENMASEQAARMVAMKSASDNAANLIDDFQLMYNKARQSAITQELSEIVAGAAAV